MDFVYGCRVDGAALPGYAADSWRRFAWTLSMVPKGPAKVLELGACPYFLTACLRTFRPEAQLRLANFLGSSGSQRHSQGDVSWDASFQEFNCEKDPFPYKSGTFDLVLFCEIIEHLVEDPLWALREIHRVLTPGRTLVLTTPNAVRLENCVKVMEGCGFMGPYSDNGTYGRHNREYSPGELRGLLEFAGFSVRELFTKDSAAPVPAPRMADLVRKMRGGDGLLGQYTFVRAVADQAPAEGRPAWLYQGK